MTVSVFLITLGRLPLRRYVDMVNQRQIIATLKGEKSRIAIMTPSSSRSFLL